MGFLHADVLNLKTLFGYEVSYRIPQFQRPYAWKKDEQWVPLWEDVRKVAENILSRQGGKAPPHFMGAIVLLSQESRAGEVAKQIVVDGQQRLTTLQLLIRAAQDSFQSLNDTDRANRLSELTLNGEAHWGGDSDNQTKIRQSNLNDQRSFQEAIRASGEGQGSLRAIGEAFQYFKGEVTDWLNKEPANRVSRSNALEEALVQHLQVAAIDLDEGEKPHRIFAILNTRGEPLKQSDHVKNAVMYEADVVDDRSKAGELWGMFDSHDSNDWWRQDTKEARLDRIHLDRFLNYWVVTRLGQEVTADQVSSKFSEIVETEKKSHDLTPVAAIENITASLRKAGVIYQDMEEARQPGIETFLRRIKTLEIGVVMPPLLWLYTRDVAGESRQRCVRALESYLVRRMLCGLSSSGLNKLFIELIGRLEPGGVAQADSTVIEFLSGQTVENRIWPKDVLLAESLIQKPLRGSPARQKMVLEAIEMSLRSDKTEAPGQSSNLTVEHIMPQSWERNWPLSENTEEATESRKQAVKEIGNLTLITGKLNASVSNAAWSEKRGELRKHTASRLNWELLDDAPEVWDEASIHARSRQLCEVIKGIWPYADKI